MSLRVAAFNGGAMTQLTLISAQWGSVVGGDSFFSKESPSEVSDCEVSVVGCTPPTADVGPLSILKLDNNVLPLPFGAIEGVTCTVGNDRGSSVSTVAGNSPAA
jgi:hypothetical protein